MKKSHSEFITDYIIRAENAATALSAAEKAVSDSLLVVVVLKGLPGNYTPFMAVITQQQRIQNIITFSSTYLKISKWIN